MLMAHSSGTWTLAELDRLPEDGNSYELVDGALFVTPPPSPAHEQLAARLLAILVPYVGSQALGFVYTPRAVVRTDESEVEPDLMVRPDTPTRPQRWVDMPTPSLVVEIVSKATQRRDHNEKRAFYRRIGVTEYWIVDRYTRSIRVVRQSADDVVESARLSWWPDGATEPLNVDVAALFSAALGAQ
jgi:Uma2 family endonuclease